MRVHNRDTPGMSEKLRSRHRAVLVGLGLVGIVLALTWVVLYLAAGATSAP